MFSSLARKKIHADLNGCGHEVYHRQFASLNFCPTIISQIKERSIPVMRPQKQYGLKPIVRTCKRVFLRARPRRSVSLEEFHLLMPPRREGLGSRWGQQLESVKKIPCRGIYPTDHRPKLAGDLTCGSARTEFNQKLTDEEHFHVISRKPPWLLQIFLSFMACPLQSSTPCRRFISEVSFIRTSLPAD